jgi:hypothetical protein
MNLNINFIKENNMKIAFVILTALTLVSTCNAALVDKFKCTIELSDFVTKNSSKVDKEFFIARLPFYSNQPQNVKFTMGQSSEQLTLNTANGVLSTNLNFYYKFAVMNENNAASSEARQLTCLGLSGDYCEKSGNSSTPPGLQICSKGVVSCKEPQNPFDQINGWTPTYFSGSLPMFNQQTLNSTIVMIKDNNGLGNNVGSVVVNCQFMSTYL